MTSTLMARSEARRRLASVWNGVSPASRRAGSGGTTTDSPAASTAAPGVASGSPARKCFPGVGEPLLSGCFSPRNSLSACSAVSQRPSFVMPMGTTSYFVLSIAFKTDAADSNDTSCSPLRPPKRMPTRSFAITFQSGARRVSRQPQLWFGVEAGQYPVTTLLPASQCQRRVDGVMRWLIEFLLDVLLDEFPFRAQRHFPDGEL